MTQYRVIHIAGGRRAGKYARQQADDFLAKGLCVLVNYEARTGWGDYLLLPEGFDSSKVSFFKSEADLEAEAKASFNVRSDQLRAEIEAVLPEARVWMKGVWQGGEPAASINANQEVFSDTGWNVCASSVQEALDLYKERLALWKEWNERGLATYLRYGRENPGPGSIQVFPSPTYAKRVGVSVRTAENETFWVIFERQEDSSWVETGTSVVAPSPW